MDIATSIIYWRERVIESLLLYGYFYSMIYYRERVAESLLLDGYCYKYDILQGKSSRIPTIRWLLLQVWYTIGKEYYQSLLLNGYCYKYDIGKE